MGGSFQLQMVAMVVGAMTLIVGGDVAARMLSSAGFSQLFVAWVRFALAALVLAPFCGVQTGELRMLRRPSLILRACFIAAGIACLLTALKTEPLANVFGGFFVGPIVSFALSVVFLKERATWLRAALLLVSFCGVMLVVKPGFGMTTGMVFAVLAGICHGCYLMMTRWLAGDYRPRFLLLSQLLIGAVVLAPFAIGPLPAITLSAAALFVVTALGSALGNLLLVLASRRSEATVIAPFIYSQIVIATLFGLLFFDEWPDGLALAGLCVVIVAGAGSVWAARR